MELHGVTEPHVRPANARRRLAVALNLQLEAKPEAFRERNGDSEDIEKPEMGETVEARLNVESVSNRRFRFGNRAPHHEVVRPAVVPALGGVNRAFGNMDALELEASAAPQLGFLHWAFVTICLLGSFVTARSEPNNVDIVMLMDNMFDVSALKGAHGPEAILRPPAA